MHANVSDSLIKNTLNGWQVMKCKRIALQSPQRCYKLVLNITYSVLQKWITNIDLTRECGIRRYSIVMILNYQCTDIPKAAGTDVGIQKWQKTDLT